MSRPTPTTRRRRWAAATAATGLVAAAAVFVIASPGEAGSAPAPAAPAAVPVGVAAVESREVQVWDEFSGRLEAVERVSVRSRVAGTVLAAHFREGALVKAGELLFTIDPAPYQAAVDRAEAQRLSAEARLAYTSSELARAQTLWADRAIAQRELDERANAEREAAAALRAAQAVLQSARLDLGYTQVRAPVAGRVGRIEVTQGNLVAAGPGAPVLTSLVSVSPIYASFDADEAVVRRGLAALGTGGARPPLERIPVELAAGPAGEKVQGRLQLVDNQVDAASGTVRLRAVFDNPQGTLMPGQFAKLRMGQPAARSALLVSERAVGTDQHKRFVLVVGADHKLVYREVELGSAVDGLRIVERGLQAGEQVVVNGLQRVRPGAEVQPQPVPMAPAALAPQARRDTPTAS